MAIFRRFKVQQKYVNGQPTEEYRLGVEVDGINYHSLEACQSGSECTELEYRWVDMESADDYICDGTNKYKKQKKQQKCVNEETWTDVYPYEYQKGDLIEQNSVDCGHETTGKYHIRGKTDGHGSINISPSKEYYSSTDVVTITALPSTNYMFSCYNYGGNMTYGSVAYNSVLSLTMSHNWYVSAMFRSVAPSVGSLYYSCYDGREFWYEWSKSTLSKSDNAGSLASIIIDYSGVIQTIPSSAFSSQSYLISISLPNCSYIGKAAFYSCHKLQSVSLPLCVYLDASAFNYCWALQLIDLPVCSYINSNTFHDCYTLSLVNLPNCTFVGSSAFDNCRAISSISLPLCEYLGEDALWGCKALQSIDLPKCLKVGGFAFHFCTSLQSISLPLCSSIDRLAFNGCETLSSIDLPLCNYVGIGAFNECSNLRIVHLPKVKRFGGHIFQLTDIETLYMDQITSVPSGVDPFGSAISNLKSIFVPCSLIDDFLSHSIWSKYSSYYVCPEIKELFTSTDGGGIIVLDPEGGKYYGGTTVNITYKNAPGYVLNCFQYGSTPAYGLTEINESFSLVMSQNWYVSARFDYNGGLYYSYVDGTYSYFRWLSSSISKGYNSGSNASTIIDYSSHITYVGDFSNLRSLTMVSFPNAVTLESYAFSDCINLSKVDMPKLEYIGSGAFRSTEITDAYFPNAEYIGSGAFQWIKSLKSVVLFKASRLNGYTFNSCYSLTTVNIPKASIIGAYEFDSCYDLENLNAPLVESIGAYAFRSCHRLDTIDFEKVSYVGEHAFTDCFLTKAVLPNALKIGSYAFEGCKYLSELYLTNVSKVTVAGSNIFSGCDRIQTVYIPCSLVEDFCSQWDSASWSLFSCIGSHIECTLSWTTWVYSYGWTSTSDMYWGATGHAIWYTRYDRKITSISINYNDYIITPSSPWYMLDTVQFSTRHNYILKSDTFLITRQSIHVSLYIDQYVLWYSNDGTSSLYSMSQTYYRTGYLGSSSWENCGYIWSNVNSLPSDAVTVYLHDQEIVRIDDYGLPESNNLETLYIGRSFDNASKHIYDKFFKYASKLTSIYITNNSKTYFISGSNNYIRYSTRLSQGGIYVSSSLLSYYQQKFNYISDLFKAYDI